MKSSPTRTRWCGRCPIPKRWRGRRTPRSQVLLSRPARKPGALLSDPLPWWEKHVVRAGIPALAIRTAHIRMLAGLPEFHKDPFDRILVAQALAEGLTLVSKDAVLARY